MTSSETRIRLLASLTRTYGSMIMSILRSHLSTSPAEFKANREHHLRLARELEERLTQTRQGGGAEARARHESRGKLFVRERVRKLLDPGSAFLELSPLAAWDAYDGTAPSAGVVTGVGVVHGREVVVVANDATVKGGTYF